MNFSPHAVQVPECAAPTTELSILRLRFTADSLTLVPPHSWNGSFAADERRKGQMCERNLLALQTSAGACVHAATRISNKIPNINAPKTRSIAPLIKSGFSKSSRRTKPPPKESEGGLAESALKREGAPSCQASSGPTGTPLTSLGGDTQPPGVTLSRYMQCVNGSTVLEDRQ